MSVQFNPTPSSAFMEASQTPIEIRPPASLGNGEGTSTLQSMAPAKASSCCLWEMLSSLWNWLKGLFSSSSEIRPSPLERRQAVIEENLKKVLENHFSDDFLDQWECKAGVVLKLGGRIFVQYRSLAQENVIPFRNEISNQATEFVKYELEILPSDAKLSIETYFLKRVDGRNRVVILDSRADTHIPESGFTSISLSGGRSENPLGRWIIERMKDCPPDFKQFFLVP